MLSAAREVFVAQGYHAASMDEIAERSGVSKPVLYQHFAGKLELYLALLDEACDALTEAVQEALASTTVNRDRALATAEAYFRFTDDEAGAFRLVFESDLTSEPQVRERLARVTDVCVDAVSGLIRADAGLDEQQARLLAAGLVGLQQHAARWWLTQERPVPLEDAAGLVASVAWRGLRRLPAADGEPEERSAPGERAAGAAGGAAG
ncbi:TetR family transcriptional regulator [Motilibacter rhizosphaerae]|uniref:TetR family transcriptional regulator n=1 Tax=Motilibacter rhizosphaerae TaxID=598652 RepID=A0A4Q7NPI4_9ACTN|nr:TetR/AcrR family transcriptional regulator [Motilibacter rhizosphaerae]RZS87215.1 TetR family transcriptional regulator [Motilibacter rhizosphaerae]